MKTTKDYNINQREKLILDTFPDNFKDDSFISKINNGDEQYNNNIFRGVDVWETTKFFILITSKGGSTITRKIILDNNLSLPNTDNLKNYKALRKYKNFQSIENEYKDTEIDIEFIEYFKALKGKSKKDIIIVTRNPIIKWMSGVIQEMEIIIANSPIVKNILKINQHEYDSEFEYNLNLLRNLLPSYLDETWERASTFVDGHAFLYNEYFFQLLTINKGINFNKLYIVDIDNPNHNLYDVIKNYYPEIKEIDNTQHFWTHRDKHEYVFNNLEMYLEEKKFSKPLIKLLKKEISYDYKWYKILLKTYENNLWKNKK